ncbi:hypothetical protein ACFT0G_40510 [Streptomyces sp. NPDC057020]|uniref:hypothetical protein n=1 Tax=Streptomycetaceae TaxID=2062 RepID=UPI00342B3F40
MEFDVPMEVESSMDEVPVTISTKGVSQSDLPVWLALGALRTVESISREGRKATRRKLVAVLASQVKELRRVS